jgi:hypothetical protein
LDLIGYKDGTGIRNFQAGNGPQQRRFTATGRPQEGKNTALEFKGDVIQGVYVFESLAQPFDF